MAIFEITKYFSPKRFAIDFQFSLDSFLASLFFDDDEGRFPENWWTFTAANLAFKIAIHPKNEHRSMSLPSKQNNGLLKFTTISWKPPWISEHVLMGKFSSNFTFYILIVKQMGFLIVRVTCEFVGWIWNWISVFFGFPTLTFWGFDLFWKVQIWVLFVGFFWGWFLTQKIWMNTEVNFDPISFNNFPINWLFKSLNFQAVNKTTIQIQTLPKINFSKI